MKIKNVRVYGLEESIIRSGYPHQIGEPKLIIPKKSKLRENGTNPIFDDKDILRVNKLTNTPVGSGHDNFLKGIIIQFDILYPQYFAQQLQRYNFVDIISSQSKMHKLTSIEDIGDNCNKYVLDRIINEVNILIEIYNDNDFPYNYSVFSTNPEGEDVLLIKDKNHCFQYIISNLPMGYQLWMGISTNYLQLKTIYNQRCKHKHKLEDWIEFGKFIESLPMSELITGKND